MKNYNIWNQIPQQLLSVCSNFDRLWITRKKRLDTHSVLLTVLRLISDSNQSYKNALRELQITGNPPSASSLSDARRKIPAWIFGEVRNEILAFWDAFRLETHQWYGFEVFAVDGTKVNIPRKCEAEGFYRAKNSYYPQALVSGLIRVADRMIVNLDFSSKTNERDAAGRLIENLGANDLVMYDKGYLSYTLLAQHNHSRVDALFRTQAGQSFKAITDFRKSDLVDSIVDIVPSKEARLKAKNSLDFAVPSAIRVRLIKHFIGDEMHILLTTVACNTIPAKAFIDLYLKRWFIEEFYKVFKCRMEIEDFHSKNGNGVEQEVHAASLLWNFSRKLESFAPENAFKKSPSVFNYIALSS